MNCTLVFMKFIPVKKRRSFKILFLILFIIFLFSKQGFTASNYSFTLLGSPKSEFNEIQQSCENVAETYVKDHYGSGLVKNDSLTSTNYEHKSHFNRKLNRCFLVIHITFNDKHLPRKWQRTLLLLDVNDSKEYGKFNIGQMCPK